MAEIRNEVPISVVQDEFAGDDTIRSAGIRGIANQKLLFTYKHHIDKAQLKRDFQALMGDRAVLMKEFYVAHENGHDPLAAPYPHTHIAVDLGFRFQTKDMSFFDIVWNGELIHPNIKFAKGIAMWRNFVQYIAKEDPENAHLKKTSVVAGIWKSESKEEALLSYCTKPSDAGGVLQIFNMKPQVNDFKPPDFHNWARDVELRILTKREVINFDDHKRGETYVPGHFENGIWIKAVNPTPRSLIPKYFCRNVDWLHDPAGNNGKTTFEKLMRMSYPEKVLFLQGIPNNRDLGTIVLGAIESGWSGDTIMLNLSRTIADHKIYESLENLADGCLTSQKYQGKAFQFDVEHVWVFANFMPKISAITEDRWRFWTIDEDNTLDFIPLGKAKKIYREEKAERMREQRKDIPIPPWMMLEPEEVSPGNPLKGISTSFGLTRI